MHASSVNEDPKIFCINCSNLKFGEFSHSFSIFSKILFNREEFDKNTIARNYSQFELAEDFGCDIEKEYPERLGALKLSKGNTGESLADYGLKYFIRYIDYSRRDKQGKCIPEHEIKAIYPNGARLEDVILDLNLLEPDINPSQRTLGRCLKKDSFWDDFKEFIRKYNKKHVHDIHAFSIEANPVRNNFLLEYKSYNELQDSNSFGELEPKRKNYMKS